jgi:hypothetical protein
VSLIYEKTENIHTFEMAHPNFLNLAVLTFSGGRMHTTNLSYGFGVFDYTFFYNVYASIIQLVRIDFGGTDNVREV